VFAPLCLLAVEIERLVRQGMGDATTARSEAPFTTLDRWKTWWRLLKPWRWDVVQIGLIGMIVTLVYCGSDWQPEPSFVAWAQQLQPGRFADGMVWLSEHLRIFPNGAEALVRQVKHNLRGHGTYLLGRTEPRSIWYYFPVALSIKLTVSLVALPLLLAVLRPRALLNWACLAAGVLLLYSLRCNVQIGIRLMLPLVALGVAGLAGALVQAWRESRFPWQRYLLKASAVSCVAWAVFAAVRVWPNALCYTNELWGGTAKGYLCLSDSNYDWGQGLKELARWHQKHPERPLDVWYFGSDPALESLPVREMRFHLQTIPDENAMMAQVGSDYLAVSTTLLYGSVSTILRSNPAREQSFLRTVAYLRGCRPVDRTATFLIYDFSKLRGQTAIRPTPGPFKEVTANLPQQAPE
jgi:hypothetical protein